MLHCNPVSDDQLFYYVINKNQHHKKNNIFAIRARGSPYLPENNKSDPDEICFYPAWKSFHSEDSLAFLIENDCTRVQCHSVGLSTLFTSNKSLSNNPRVVHN